MSLLFTLYVVQGDRARKAFSSEIIESTLEISLCWKKDPFGGKEARESFLSFPLVFFLRKERKRSLNSRTNQTTCVVCAVKRSAIKNSFSILHCFFRRNEVV